MSIAGEILARCRAAGVTLTVGAGGVLDWEADSEPQPSLLVLIKKHKVHVIRELAKGHRQPPAGNWQRWVADAIAKDLGLPPGGALYRFPEDACPGCCYCTAKCTTTEAAG